MSGISVILPVYNRKRLVIQTLISLLAQTVPADEIIVVDDGSTDGTSEAIQKFFRQKQDTGRVPSLKLVRQENQGPAAARNLGVMESKGEFLHFFDSDDIAVSNKHEVQLDVLRSTGGDIAYGPWVKGRFSNGKFHSENLVFQQKGIPKGNLVRSLLTNWSIVPHACLFKRSIVEKSGGFPEHLRVAEDQLMFLRCLLKGARVVHSPHTLELYRTENTEDKITSISEGETRRKRHWGRFLIEANRECLSHRMNPADWFGFRKRCWQAGQEILRLEPAGESLVQDLFRLAESTSTFLYRLSILLDRLWGGLQSRISGGRAHRSFRMGSLSGRQVEWIEKVLLETNSSAVFSGRGETLNRN